MKPLVDVIMGSASDWETMQHCVAVLEQLGVPHEVRVVSAHRTPDLLFEYASSASGRGLEVLVAGAGGAAHLPGMTAWKTLLPVIGVPVQSKSLNGLDSLLSIVQMPAGIPVATVAIGSAGAKNAGHLAAQILALADPALAARVRADREPTPPRWPPPTRRFAASVAGIRSLLAAGLAVTANTTLSEINADRFLELAEIAAGLGVQRMGFARLVPSGRGAGLADRMLRAEKVERLYERIFSSSCDGMKFVTGDPVGSQMRRSSGPDGDEGEVPIGGCSAGVSGLTILADGTIVTCRRLPLPLGNVRTDALREVWVASPVLEALRDRSRYEGKCGSCDRWASCRGCRAIAYAASRIRGEAAVLAPDPQCPF